MLTHAQDAAGSYDFNDHVSLPTPVLPEDHHGTRCGGQIAAIKNNACGVGIAHTSKVAGIRILSGPISDIDEAASLNYGFQNTSIFSCSWGPADDGRSMEAPGYLVEKAVVNGINNGRGGKGSVFVFASGNGAGWGDQCNFDGYTNSIYSITVGSIDFKDLHPPYSEACAANMIVAYSSGSGNHIVSMQCLANNPIAHYLPDNHRCRKRQVFLLPRWYIRCCAKRCGCLRSRPVCPVRGSTFSSTPL
jgi:kexin